MSIARSKLIVMTKSIQFVHAHQPIKAFFFKPQQQSKNYIIINGNNNK